MKAQSYEKKPTHGSNIPLKKSNRNWASNLSLWYNHKQLSYLPQRLKNQTFFEKFFHYISMTPQILKNGTVIEF